MEIFNNEVNIKIKRKCGCCGEYLYISKNNINEAIYYDKKTYHSRCFTNMCEKRINNKRKDISEKWKSIYNHINLIEKDTYNHLIVAIERDEIFKFIRDNYNLTIIPTIVWQKLKNIYSGTFKGMSIGIPPCDLLDMWKRKINMLNGIAKNNEIKGIYMQPEQRVNYDLTILINKYDSYLRWKEKQKILEIEKESHIEQNIVNQSIGYINFNNKNKQNDIQENRNDISNLVDDIFG
jgi:hypothetical protein